MASPCTAASSGTADPSRDRNRTSPNPVLDDFLARGDGPAQFRTGVRPGPASATVERQLATPEAVIIKL
jgi:hypothetical protein